MYKVRNTIEDIIVFEGNEIDFIDFMKVIVIENCDYETSITSASDAKEYLEEYCDNLELLN